MVDLKDETIQIVLGETDDGWGELLNTIEKNDSAVMYKQVT